MASAARSSCSHGAMVPWCHGNHRTALRSRLRDAKESRGGLGRMMQARTDLPLLCRCMLQLFTLSLSYSSEAVFNLFGMHLMAGNFRALSASERKHVNASVVAAQGCPRLHNIRQSVSWIFGCRRIWLLGSCDVPPGRSRYHMMMARWGIRVGITLTNLHSYLLTQFRRDLVARSADRSGPTVARQAITTRER